MRRRAFLFLPIFLLLAWPALAQEITFSSDVVQANGEATPTLTWDTLPLATNCVASGDWSGDKGGAGNETLPTIVSSATYNLTCTWAGLGAATLSWVPPTENTDGSALTDLAGYRIYWSASSDGLYENMDVIDSPGVTTYIVEPLSEGTWFFVATAVNERGVESAFSNEASKVVEALDATDSIGITINPVPAAPTGLLVE